MNTNYLIVYCTVGSLEEGKRIGEAIVEDKLAACCNIVPNLTSIYSWQGKTETDSELLLIIKTKKDVYLNLEKRIQQLHSYEVPEILALPIESGNKSYLEWVDKNVD